MAILLTPTDFNQLFAQWKDQGIILNELDPISDAELIKRLTVLEFKDAKFSLIPSCLCGETNLKDNPDMMVGDRCPYCLTTIQSPISRSNAPTLWVRPPEGIPGFISPLFLAQLLNTFASAKAPKTSIIHWLLDPKDKLFNDYRLINFFLDNGVQRGITYFINNMDWVMSLLMQARINNVNSELRSQLGVLYQLHKAKLVCEHLPVPDNTYNVIEHSSLGSYVDSAVFNPYMNSVNTILSLNKRKTPAKQDHKEHVVFKFLINLVRFYKEYIKSFQNVKEGEYRRNVYGSRVPWTMRTVISSLHGVHDIEERHIPWSAAVALFEVHITSKLLRLGYSPKAIRWKIYNAISIYDEEIDNILKELINDSPFKTRLSGKPGIPIIDNRNPSLKIGSIQLGLVTKVKTDPIDITSELSTLILSAYNGDFDGKQHCLVV